MRFIALLLITSFLAISSEFPETFNSAGDEVYENMQRYLKIKHLKIFQDRPEFLESFCVDANTSMQKGFALDRAKEDPEAKIDKGLIKSYAKELRRLSNQNEAIKIQLQVDIKKLYEAGDLSTLAQIEKSGFLLDEHISKAIAEDAKQKAVDEVIAKANLMQAEQNRAVEVNRPKAKEVTVPEQIVPEAVVPPAAKVAVPEEIVETTPKVARAVQAVRSEQREEVLNEVLTPAKAAEPIAEISKSDRKPTELEYYQQSLINLKAELYALRDKRENEVLDVNDSLADQRKTECLNDITAINYWMIKVLENEKDACALSDAIRQMKSYDKSAATSCGRESMRYIEWHGRIKPYVGSRLFQAEALCPR